MYVVVSQVGTTERRWHGAPRRGVVSAGAALEGDVHLVGHNIAARHVRLHFGPSDDVRIEVRSAYAVRVDGRPPRRDARLAPGGRLAIGPWILELAPHPPTGIDPVDDAFLAMLAAAPGAEDARAVYADSLEERGRTAEAELVRGVPGGDVARLAARTPPAWRRRALPIAVEECPSPRERCPARWNGLPTGSDETARACPSCARRVVLFGHLGAAREHALRGRPVAIDPAVRRWPGDLRDAVVKRPVIDMGQPTGIGAKDRR